MTTILDGPADVLAAVGRHLGRSEWLTVDAERIARFRAATGDPDASYLALALTNMFLPQIVEVRGFAMGLNYGTDRVAPSFPLRAGDRVRGAADLVEVIAVPSGLQTTMRVTVDVEGRAEPVCVVDALSRWIEEHPAGPSA